MMNSLTLYRVNSAHPDAVKHNGLHYALFSNLTNVFQPLAGNTEAWEITDPNVQGTYIITAQPVIDLHLNADDPTYLYVYQDSFPEDYGTSILV